MKNIRKIYENHIGVSATVTVVVMMGLLHFIRMVPLPYEVSFLFAESIVATIMVIIIYLINGEGKLLFSTKGLGFAFKLAWWPVLVTIIMPIFIALTYIISGQEVSGNPVLIIIGAMILAMLVGYFEESLFRGIVLNAFLLKNGGSFKGILLSCIYSSVIFGFVHVYSNFFTFFTDPSTFSTLALLQVIEKTLSAGLFGFVLSVIFIRTHNLFNVALMHGINDFFPFVLAFLLNKTNITNYVSANSTDAFRSVIGYAIEVVLTLPAAFYAYKKLKNGTVPQWGMFKEPWYPHSVRKKK